MVENLFKKKSLQDLLSSLNAVISTNENTRNITGHVIYSPAYTYKFQLKTTLDGSTTIHKHKSCPTPSLATLDPRRKTSNESSKVRVRLFRYILLCTHKALKIRYTIMGWFLVDMAIWVVEFSNGGYKIRKIFD